uniref:Annexin n=1 Tax=Salvator merianae TaxID=96440 RepID=A0A8D0C594_SALMN
MSLVQQFLKQAWFIENDEPQYVQNTKTGSAVKACPSFNASTDAAALDKAITVKGVDEATIIEILTKRTNAQRQQIKAAYQQLKGKPLEDDLKKALKSHLEDVVVALLKTPAQFDAEELRYSMKGLGTDEDILVEILSSRSNAEIRAANRAYQEIYKRDLAKDIASDTSGDFQKVLLALARGDRDENPHVNDELADNDARAMYDAGERKKGTDVNALSLSGYSLSVPHLSSSSRARCVHIACLMDFHMQWVRL